MSQLGGRLCGEVDFADATGPELLDQTVHSIGFSLPASLAITLDDHFGDRLSGD
ncbi:hypothetical protein AU15_19340 [Marinobacter salarius]|uniref:Uncharacterized protein n=1 Tax=Marinobacter salarius TaxID=1420917 RepID=W5Z4K8_9GAMM|nr:hypothetical protein AU15_19340 [Marinobacter salarius]